HLRGGEGDLHGPARGGAGPVLPAATRVCPDPPHRVSRMGRPGGIGAALATLPAPAGPPLTATREHALRGSLVTGPLLVGHRPKRPSPVRLPSPARVWSSSQPTSFPSVLQYPGASEALFCD